MTDAPIALITGGAQGIGLACARALAADGYKVVLADVKESVHAAAAELNGAAYICDLGDAEAVLELFDKIEAEHGPVAALVNNAGIARAGDFLDYDLDTFDAVLNVV